MRRFIIIIAVIGIVSIIIWLLARQLRSAQVEVIRVTRGSLEVEFYARGEVEATEVTLSARIPGRVRKLLVDEGDRVTKGQLVIALSNSEIETAVKEAQAALAAARARARSAQATLEQVRAQVDAQLQQARARVKEAEAALAEAEHGARTEERKAGHARVDEVQAIAEAARKQLEAAQVTYAAEKARIEAEIEAAHAQVRAAECKLQRLKAGTRKQEIEQARAALRMAEAQLALTRKQWERTKYLYEHGAVARNERDAALSAYETAQAQVERAKQQLSLLEAGTHPDEIKAAQAELDAAKARLQTALAAKRQLEARQKAIEAARAQVKQAEAQLEQAKQQYALLEHGTRVERIAIMRAQLEAARAGLAVALASEHQIAIQQQECAAAQANLERSKALLDAARAQARELQICSPIDGYVVRKVVDVGEVVTPGAPLLTLIASDRAWVIAKVDEEDIAKLHLGQTVTIDCPAYPDRTFAGVVTNIGAAAQRRIYARTEARIVRVRIDLPSAKGLLKPGMEVNVHARVRLKSNVLLLPRDALMGEGDKEYVFVVSNGRAYKRAVHTGFASYDFVEIVTGLRGGELVVVRGKEGLHDGAKVQYVMRAKQEKID